MARKLFWTHLASSEEKSGRCYFSGIAQWVERLTSRIGLFAQMTKFYFSCDPDASIFRAAQVCMPEEIIQEETRGNMTKVQLSDALHCCSAHCLALREPFLALRAAPLLSTVGRYFTEGFSTTPRSQLVRVCQSPLFVCAALSDLRKRRRRAESALRWLRPTMCRSSGTLAAWESMV